MEYKSKTMKKIISILTIFMLALVTTGNAQPTEKKNKEHQKEHKKEHKKNNTNKGHKKGNQSGKLKGGGDGIDDRMKGPNGEAVMIGKKGGRYYLSPTGEKVYLQRGLGYKKGGKKNKKNK
jgi:Ni/Co efflux regulator RcnB